MFYLPHTPLILPQLIYFPFLILLFIFNFHPRPHLPYIDPTWTPYWPFPTFFLHHHISIVFPPPPPPPLPHFYCFPSTTTATFLLFSLHYHHRHISTVFPPPPPPHFYCFPSSSFLLFLHHHHHLHLLISIVFPRKDQKAKIRPIRPNSNVMVWFWPFRGKTI